MAFNPDIHNRRSIRLRDFDYSRAGAYFVTICVWQRECLFGEVADGEMRLNEIGSMVHGCWDGIPDHFPRVELDAWIIMPNHVHGILVISDDPVGAQFIAPEQFIMPESANPVPGNQGAIIQGAMNRAPTLGAIVRAFKARCTHAINQSRNNPGAPVWQRNYYERVIRDERELDGIRQYIAGNPAKWEEDENHPAQM